MAVPNLSGIGSTVGNVRANVVRNQWHTQRLEAAIVTGTKASWASALADAKGRRHNTSRSDVTLKPLGATHAQLRPKGLMGVFELGRHGGYPITPGGIEGLRKSRIQGVTTYRVRGGTGSATALSGPFLDHPLLYTTGGKMGRYPAIRPAADDWRKYHYPRVTARVLRAQGFRPR